jgi:glutamate-1-semialdehyde 2,1-aminomutase
MNLPTLYKQSEFTPGQTLSKMPERYPDNYPKVLTNGFRGHVWDEEGRKYVDLISALGAISVGYCNPIVNLAVEEQIQKGVTFSLPTRLEWEAAEKLTQLVPNTDMWKFGKTGTDGVLMAVRAARAYTGRKKILTLGYHGCSDHFECLGTRKAGMIDMSKYTDPIVDNSEPSLRYDLFKKEYAAVVLEPWTLKQEISKKLREFCDATETLLIADEVVTGGRFEGFTASSYIGVVPDLYVLGKGLANGFPLCAVGGTRRIMSTFERDDFFASGTFNGETVSLAAFLATQEILQRQIQKMVWNGNRIKEAFNKLSWSAKCVGYPTRLDFQFDTDKKKYKFWQEMCKRGILIGYNNFIMADHTDEDVTYVINAIYDYFKVKDKVELEGSLPQGTVRTNG